MVPSNPQHEISNQLKARCCGRVAQYEPRIASEYIYILYSVSIYLSVCLFLCLSVCLPVSLYAVNVLYVYMHGSVCIGGVCVCICCLLCTQPGACTGDSISRFVPVQRQHVFFWAHEEENEI
jgi:hypothetical protein